MGRVVITIEFQEGSTVSVSTSSGEEVVTAQPATDASAVIATVRIRTRPELVRYVDALIAGCVAEGCTIATPLSAKGGFTDSWAIMLPPRCRRRAKAGAVNYRSTRVAAFAGRPDLKKLGFKVAQEARNKSEYAYPKIPRLDSDSAVEEAVELIKLAIKHFGG